MSKRFDPYYEWLDIPPGGRPPDFYELLGIDKFESNQGRIKRAANARKKKLNEFVGAERSTTANSLIKEISQAYQILSQPKRKAAYDQRLRHLLSAGQTQRSFHTFVESDPSNDPNNPLSASAGNWQEQGTLMHPKKSRESNRASDFPIVTILICMGLFTIVASIGIFAWITNRTVVTLEPEAPQVRPAVENVQNAEPAKPPVVATDSITPDKVDPQGPVVSDDNRVERAKVDDPTEQGTADAPTVTAPSHSESDGIAPVEMAKWKSLLGLTATLEGVVLREGESSSRKTRYLWFSNDRDNVAMVFMLTREIGNDLSLEYLRSLKRKKIRVTGTVKEQFGTNRIGVTIQNQDQIEIVE